MEKQQPERHGATFLQTESQERMPRCRCANRSNKGKNMQLQQLAKERPKATPDAKVFCSQI